MATHKQMVTGKFPKAKCSMNWGKGSYRVTLGATVKNRYGFDVVLVETGTANPAEAWERVAYDLNLI